MNAMQRNFIEGKRLVSKLYEISKGDKENILSPSYTEALQKLEMILPDAVETFYFRGVLALNLGKIDVAKTLLLQAWEKRKLNQQVLYALSCIFKINDFEASIHPSIFWLLSKYLGANEEAMKAAGIWDICRYYYPPLGLTPFYYVGGIPFTENARYAPALYVPLPYGQKDGEPPYRAGIMNEINALGRGYSIIESLGTDETHLPETGAYGDIDFDIMRMEEVKSATIEINNKSQERKDGETPFVIYALGSLSQQILNVAEDDRAATKIDLHGFEPRPMRFDKKVRLSSEQPFALSRPIFLRHSKKRRKLVLNILTDGLSWAMEKSINFVDVPNICRFFQDGIIFDDNFSVAEYTRPSHSAIEAGMHLHRSQIFNDYTYTELSGKYQTISEQMTDLGYYSVNVMDYGMLFTNSVGRGYDRWIIDAGFGMKAAQGVDRLLHHLDAFEGTDNFVLLHICDSHPYGESAMPLESSMTHFPVEVFQTDKGKNSVFMSPNPMSQAANHEQIRRMDAYLGVLFDYIHTHYRKDEVMINLFSDHGFGIYDNDWLLADNHVGAALMCYGGDVPALGHVDELTSSLDLYKIMGHVLGFPIDMDYLDGELPKAFGGNGHNYVISNSIYPGQTYKLAIRTRTHEFRLQTEAKTAQDGSVDISAFQWSILDRKTRKTVVEDVLVDYFFGIAKRHTQPFWNLFPQLATEKGAQKN